MTGLPDMCSHKTEDVGQFGDKVWVYCNQHLRPHLTGWCTVPARDKTALEATSEDEAYTECYVRGFKLYNPTYTL